MKTRVAEARSIKEGVPMTPAQCSWAALGDFPDLMRNRVVQGQCRYGDMRDAPVADEYDGEALLERLKQKLALFEMTRNHEMLVDVAVFAALLFRFDTHPEAHFEVVDQGATEDYIAARKMAASAVRDWTVPRLYFCRGVSNA